MSSRVGLGSRGEVPCPGPCRTVDSDVEPSPRAVTVRRGDETQGDEVRKWGLQTARRHAQRRRQVIETQRPWGLHEGEHDAQSMSLAEGVARHLPKVHIARVAHGDTVYVIRVSRFTFQLWLMSEVRCRLRDTGRMGIMTVTTRSGRGTHRASELIRQRNPALRVWSLHPWLDVLVAGIVGVVANGYSRYRVVPLGTVLAVALVSAIVGFGWAACIALLRRISGTPVPGLARGFPRRFARSLLRVSWQGLVLVAVVVAVCTSGLFGWADLPAAVVLSGVVVAGLGAVRCVMIARPLVQVVLRRRGGVLR